MLLLIIRHAADATFIDVFVMPLMPRYCDAALTLRHSAFAFTILFSRHDTLLMMLTLMLALIQELPRFAIASCYASLPLRDSATLSIIAISSRFRRHFHAHAISSPSLPLMLFDAIELMLALMLLLP